MGVLSGNSIICTGAGSGIGRAASVLAARAGARIIVADINDHGGQETVALIRKEGGDANFIHTDISKETDVQNMVKYAVKTYGRLDAAFNNAAIPHVAKLIHEMTLAEWERNIDITLNGTFLCMKYEIAEMLATGGGSIVNTSSGAGLKGFRAAAEYTAAKHGVIGLTRVAGLDYADKKIRVNAIAPGAVRTAMLQASLDADPNLESYIASTNPMGRLADPLELGEGVVWLLSDAASFVTGTCLSIDGGYMA
jgi:2,5-dichloro-2,5-cyclohexadiene-1,4-diol dehydrogenase 1